MSSDNDETIQLEANVAIELPLHSKTESNISRKSSHSSNDCPNEKENKNLEKPQHEEIESLTIADVDSKKEKKKIEDENNAQKSSTKQKKKLSLTKIFICGSRKPRKSMTLNGEKITAIFKNHINDSNLFSCGALCNSNSGQMYHSFPDDFKLDLIETKAISTLQKIKGEKFTVSNHEFEFYELESKNGFMGISEKDQMMVGVRYLNALMMVAVWSQALKENKDQFELCFQDIIKSSK